MGILTGPGPALFTIILFVAAAIIIYKFINSKHKERMAMIEKGFDFSGEVSKKSLKHTAARNGIFLISIGLGVFIASIWDLGNILANLGLIVLFGGIGFVIYYQKVLKHMDDKEG